MRGMASGAVFGLAIGIGVDALIRSRVTAFQAPSRSVRLDVVPLLNNGRTGAALAIRF